MRPGLHHVAYTVADIEAAIHHYESVLGAGPFKVLEHPAYDSVTAGGEPASYDHTAAFGVWGDIPVELVQLHEVTPARVADAITTPAPSLHHIAWTTPDLAAGIAELEAQGFPELLTCLLGEIQHSFHDGRATLGHHIELHRDCDMLTDFWAEVGKR
jgi:methylmalonyl-CoA/ethylmalonyl-CoA epimerase